MQVSIIIPTYNCSNVIQRAIDSVVAQTFTDWEVLIMDGASSDDTLKVVSQNTDPRIRVFSEKDKGVYDAMNKGIFASKGEWLYFLGSDDYLVDERVLQNITDNVCDDVDILYGEVIAPQLSEIYRGEWCWDKLCACRCHQSIFYRRRVFDLLGLYNLKYKVCADYDINLKWYFDERLKSKYVNIQIANYACGGLSCHVHDDLFAKDYDKLILCYGYKTMSLRQVLSYIKRIITRNYTHKDLLNPESSLLGFDKKGRN